MANLFENKMFEVEVGGFKIKVIELTLNDEQIFRLIFDDGKAPLVITKAATWSGAIWTSIPQGRQTEAELYGNEIGKYLKNQ